MWERRMRTYLLVKNLKETDHLEDLDLNGKILLMHLAQGRDQWRAFAKTVMNFGVP
jgi:hypothetical protein